MEKEIYVFGEKFTEEEQENQLQFDESKKRRRTKSPTPETSSFHVVNQKDQFKWELLDAMAEYANEHLIIFIQEKDLKESILKTIPVPSNLQEVRQMNEFMAQLLKDKRQKTLL